MGLGIVVKVGDAADPGLAGAALVEVHERLGEPTRYRLCYPVDVGDGDMTLLSNDRLGPDSELSVVVPVAGKDHVLVRGPVHGQRMRLVHGGSGSWLEVSGSDKSVAMDREHKTRVWEGSSSDAVETILKAHGLKTDVEPTKDKHEHRGHTLVQRDTDLRFVRRLARRYGCLFWVTTNDKGKSTGHFKRPPLAGSPAAALVINRDQPTISSLDISWDSEAPTSIVARQLDLADKSVIDGAVPRSPLSPLGKSALSAIAKGTRTAAITAPVDTAADLKQRGEGTLIEEGWFVRASCDTSLNALGTLVRAHTVVDVQGAGLRHSGKYLVAGVRHAIDAAAHVMELDLRRNAWGA
jgi:hypothetical protein